MSKIGQSDYEAGFDEGTKDAQAELTRLRVSFAALREEMRAQADVLREVAGERAAAIARAEAAEGAVKHVGKWANIYHDRLEKAEAERDTLRAELDRLTTLRPEIAWDGQFPVLLFDEHKRFAGNRDCGPLGFGKIPHGWYWTPIPAPQEAKP